MVMEHVEHQPKGSYAAVLLLGEVSTTSIILSL
jgi:hypothetical protein